MKDLGFIVEELDISVANEKDIQSTIHKNDMIYVSGGNTFYLLQEMRRTGTDAIMLKEITQGKPYIGESAGSIITSPNIEYVKQMDSCEEAPNLSDFYALGAVDFYTVPHYTEFPFAEIAQSIIEQHEKSISLIPINNAQAILVNGDSYEIISVK